MRGTQAGLRLLEVAGAALLAIAMSFAIATTGHASASWKRVAKVKVPKHRLFDLGVADADRDGRLDIFSVAHKFEGTYLQNLGKLKFANRTHTWGLSPEPQFPGLEALRKPKSRSKDGAYVWLEDPPGSNGRIFVAATGRPIRLTLTVHTKPKIGEARKATAKVISENEDGVTFDLKLEAGGIIQLVSSGIGELPLHFNFGKSDGLEARDIHVGHKRAKPKKTKFRIQLHDRHGMAFSDLNSDGLQDIFVVSGGVGGRIVNDPSISNLVFDQLYISSRKGRRRYVDRFSKSKLVKSTCRGRSTSMTDFNLDGKLDLLVGCETRFPYIFRGTSNGMFGRMYGGPGEPGSVYRWANLTGGAQRLVAGSRASLRVWKIKQKDWKHKSVQRFKDIRQATNISLGDLDRDGKLDVLVIADRKLHILKNGGKRLREVPPGRLGLPEADSGVAAVDFDNDGWQDVALAKNGLYRWDPQRRIFTKAGGPKSDARYAIMSWPDLDNDGRRDLVAAYSTGEFSRSSEVRVARNRVRGGRWLEVDLVGKRGNREGIGAKVVVRPKDKQPRPIVQYAGQNEGSNHSIGHYRTYFGLGKAKRADVTVHWPDGGKTSKRNVGANQLITVRR